MRVNTGKSRVYTDESARLKDLIAQNEVLKQRIEMIERKFNQKPTVPAQEKKPNA